jgi:hypothetical protein
MTGSVEVDTSDVVRGVRQLAAGVKTGAQNGTRAAASATAADIRARLPVRTGRLAATVSAVAVDGGWGVTYGGGLSYARPVAARTKAVAAGIAGDPARFARDMRTVAEKEVRRL